MLSYGMTIAGQSTGDGDTFPVFDPGTGEEVGRAPECGPGELNAAMDAARSAFPTWSEDETVRREALSACAAVLSENAEELGRLVTLEQGKPLSDGVHEIDAAARWFRYYAELEMPVTTIQDDEAGLVRVFRRPLGVVAAITPWNYPVVQMAWKVAPAFLSGNTIVVKPSPITPLATLRFAELVSPLLPSGVMNVISGGGDLGAEMTAHPVPREISLTGSIATGKLVACAASEDLKRTTLELGGNDAAILLEDTDPDEVAGALVKAAFANCGQACNAVKRVYAPRSICAQVAEALAERVGRLTIGHGLDPSSDLGPLTTARQRDFVADLVEQAVAGGGRVLTGGRRREGPGNFYEPTVVAGVSDGMPMVDEEQFGPALPVIEYATLEDAVARANGTHYGLGGSVWGRDAAAAAEVASRLECGTVWVNTHRPTTPAQPFGGAKWSGIGVANGPWALEETTQLQVVYEAR